MIVDPSLEGQLGASYLRVQPLRGLEERAQLSGHCLQASTLKLLELKAEACHRLIIEQGSEHLGIGLAGKGRIALELENKVQANPSPGELLYTLPPNQIVGIGFLSPTAQWQHLTIECQSLQKICLELDIVNPDWESLPAKLNQDASLLTTLIMRIKSEGEATKSVHATRSLNAITKMVLLLLSASLSRPFKVLPGGGRPRKEHPRPSHWSSTAAAESRPKQLVAQVTDYFNKHINQDISLAKTSDYCGVSARRIQAAFRECTETTPMQHLQQLRMQQLRRHLLRGYSVSDACQLVGLRLSGRIARIYQNQYGELPRQTRAAFNSNDPSKTSSKNIA